MSTVPGVVIVGSGVAGITAAESLRAGGYTGPVTVIGDEEHLPYRRTALSKDLLAADLAPERIRLRKPEFWTDRDLTILTGTRVAAVDTATGDVVCADGRRIGYRALLLATGGRPRSVDAIDPAVPTLRHHDDALALQRSLADGPVVIIGAGLIGLEIAASAAAVSPSVTVLESAPAVLTRVMPTEVADAVVALHRSHGTAIHTGVTVAAASPTSVTTADGRKFDGSVVAAIGMVGQTALAEAAGAAVGPAGVIVDEQLRTTVPGIYAAGDTAAAPHPLTGEPARAEQWLTATDHGKLAASTILTDLGLTVEAPAISRVPLAWTIHYSANMQVAGWPGMADRIEIVGVIDDFDAEVRCFQGDDLVGGLALGRPAAGRALRAEIEENLPVRVAP